MCLQIFLFCTLFFHNYVQYCMYYFSLHFYFLQVVRHLPLIPRIQRIFQSYDTAKMMGSYMQNRDKNTIRGLADAEAFPYLEEQYPVFFKEPRNLVLGIAADSFNPWGLRSSSYSITPVLIIVYNLPMELATKNAFMLLTLMIPGKRQVKNMDIFLQPLVDELKTLWLIGFVVRDISKPHEDHARLYGILIWTLHDYVGLGHISGSYNIFTFSFS